MKDAYYFSHDSNAKDDPKCIMLIEQLGLEGYGIFWVLIETLRDQPEHKYPLNLIPAIARRFNTTTEKMNVVVNNYGLFIIENKEFFYSKSLNERMLLVDQRREQTSLAGQKGMKTRWGNAGITALNNGVITALLQTDNSVITKKGKERKGKEKKLKESKAKSTYAENVTMTPIEYEKLIEEHGQTKTTELIEILNNYKASSGRQYKSDYATMFSWVIKRYEEDKQKAGQIKGKKSSTQLLIDKIKKMEDENGQDSNNEIITDVEYSISEL